jgi:hypothetical protein
MSNKSEQFAYEPDKLHEKDDHVPYVADEQLGSVWHFWLVVPDVGRQRSGNRGRPIRVDHQVEDLPLRRAGPGVL